MQNAAAEPPSALEDVSFGEFADALRALRHARGRARHAGRDPAPPSRDELARFAAACAAGIREEPGTAHAPRHAPQPDADTKHDVLTRLWKTVRGKARLREMRQEEERAAAARQTVLHTDTAQQGAAGTMSEQAICSSRADVTSDRREAVPAGDATEEDIFTPASALSESDTRILLSLLCPTLDETHSLYMLKERRLAEHYIDALDLRRNAADAQWLLNYVDKAFRPAPASGSRRKARACALARDGNFPSVLCAVLSERARPRSNAKFTVARVWALLDELYQNRESKSGSRYKSIGYQKYEAGTKAAARIGPEDGDMKSTGNDVQHEASGKQDSIEIVRDTKKEARLRVIRTFVAEATADENAELARIILKDLELRLKEDALLRWFHPSAQQHYNQTHDLSRLVHDCRDAFFSIGEVRAEPGSYAAVMLTARPARANLASVAEKLATGIDISVDERGLRVRPDPYFFLEPKLDGERMQLHKIGSTVVTFSRSAKDSSAMYADLLRDAVNEAVISDNAILDGEIIIWDETGGKWVSFENMRPIVLHMLRKTVPSTEFYTLKYVAFDILYVEHRRPVHDADGERGLTSPHVQVLPGPAMKTQNFPLSQQDPGSSPHSGRRQGRRRAPCSLLGLPLETRKRLLRENVRDFVGSRAFGFQCGLEVIEMGKGSSEADLTTGLNRFVEEGYEGLIAKSPDKPYGLAERNPAVGIKLKPDYFEGGLQDIDVVILAARYGTGHGTRPGRIGTLSSFLVGVRTHDGEEDRQRYRNREVCKWTPIGSVGTGYSYEELEGLQRRLSGKWRDLGRTRDSWPDFWDISRAQDYMFRDLAKWIDPRESAVLQLRAYELARAQGVALRFPRCERIRDEEEKEFFDAISLGELFELDHFKMPAIIGSTGGHDEDEVLATDATGKAKRVKLEHSTAMDALEAVKATVTHGGGGRRAVMSIERPADVSDVAEGDRKDVLRNHYFQVFASHGQEEEKHDLERRIYMLGGTFEQSRTSRTTHYMSVDADHMMIRALRDKSRSSNELRRDGELSVLSPCWLDDCESQGRPVSLKRKHVFFACKDLEESLLQDCDEYGDSWTGMSTCHSLLSSLSQMDALALRGDLANESFEDIGDSCLREAVTKSLCSAGCLFWSLTVWIPSLHLELISRNCEPLEATILLLKFFGATVLENASPTKSGDLGAATHALVGDMTPPDVLRRIQDLVASMSEAAHVALVSDAWVTSSLSEGILVEPFVGLHNADESGKLPRRHGCTHGG